MELALYNRLKKELLGEFAARAEGGDSEYQKQVEAYASSQSSGLKQPVTRKIQKWLATYNDMLPAKAYSLRYYQILALYFTEQVLSEKRAGPQYADQKALAYWMATGSGKTLLMHLNILQYIDHIGGAQAFDELQLIVTTPGVNLIEQHERELEEVVGKLNRIYNNRIKLIVASTAALLNKEQGFFNMPESSRLFRLVLVDEGHIGLSSNGEAGAFKQLRNDLLRPSNSFLFEYSATYHGIAERHVAEYGEQIVYDYNYYRFYKDGYGKDYAFQSLNDDRFADDGRREHAFFSATIDTLTEKLAAYEALRVDLSPAQGGLPFVGQVPDKPLLAFMGNTVEDPKKEGGAKDEVSDIRKFVVWLAHLSAGERARYSRVFNNQYVGRLKLTRSPGIKDEIWLSWGDGEYWGLINVGNGEKFFSDCEEHEALVDANGEALATFLKASIVNPRYHFASIDTPASTINVLVGSRKFAEGWNCFRVSIIGLINLGASKGNKIIQIYGRGVRLKGLRKDGKRKYVEHCQEYSRLVAEDTPENQLRRLETLNVYSLRRAWLEKFLAALEQDLPFIAGPYSVPVAPAVVKVGNRQVPFEEYRDKLFTFKVGQSEFDAPLRIVFDAASHEWAWQYLQDGVCLEGAVRRIPLSLDYRSNKSQSGRDIARTLLSALTDYSTFLPTRDISQRFQTWSRQQRVQLYCSEAGATRCLALRDILGAVGQILYDYDLEGRSWTVIERVLFEVQRDLLEKIFHKIRYDIDKRQYRTELVRQKTAGEAGDFIDCYNLSFEFGSDEARLAFELGQQKEDCIQALHVNRGERHIYEPLMRKDHEEVLNRFGLQRIGISPDKLNAGEVKFLKDILRYIEDNFSRDPRQFYLMRNVESLRSIGIYLDGETRVFYPDFVLWIVDDRNNKTTMVLFDPKGQSGILKEDDLGFSSADAMNDKVRVSTSGQLRELAQKLIGATKRDWSVHSFILLRDSSPLGRFAGLVATPQEVDLAERMIRQGVLRLDWHEENELGQQGKSFPNGDSYLTRIFEKLN